MYKNWVAYILILFASLGLGGLASATADSATDRFIIDQTKAMINNQEVEMAQPAKFIAGRIYVPLQYLLQAMMINTNENVKRAGEMLIIRKDGTAVQILIPRSDKEVGGAYNTIWVGNRAAEMEQALAYSPVIGDYLQAYVQVRPLALAFDYDVLYSASDKTVQLVAGKPLVDDDLSVSGLQVGIDNLDDMLKKFGSPQNLSVETADKTEREAIYAGAKITLQYSYDRNCYIVARIEFTSNNYWTQRSLKVGDDVSRMVGLYGMGYYNDQQKPEWYSYWRLSDYWRNEGVEVRVQNSRVTAIVVEDYNKQKATKVSIAK